MNTKNKSTAVYKEFVTVSDAAVILGVSIDTVRRWDKIGKLHSRRLDGKNRYFAVEELEHYRSVQPLSTSEVAVLLGVSVSTVRRLEQSGNLIPSRTVHGKREYNKSAVDAYVQRDSQVVVDNDSKSVGSQFAYIPEAQIAYAEVDDAPTVKLPSRKSSHKPQISPAPQPAVVNAGSPGVDSGFRHPIFRFVQRAVVYTVTVAILLISLFSVLLFISPATMDKFFWQGSGDDKGNGTVVSRLFQPLADRALNVVDVVRPGLKDELRPIDESDITNVFTKDEDGNLILTGGFSPSSSSDITIPDTNIINNLNSEFVSGEKPGDAEGDLAILPITTDHIKDNTVTSADIAAGTIELNNLSQAVIAYFSSNQSTVTQPAPQPNGITGVTAGQGLSGGGSSGSPTISLQTGLSTEIINNGVEVKLGTSALATTSSVSGLEVSAQGIGLLGGCSVGQLLKWNGSTWLCSSDIAGGGTFDVQEGGTTVTSPVSAINFNANDFSVTDVVGQANVVLDYANSGITRRNQNETISGTWSFANASFGTITAGTWQGTAIGTQYGGTGINTSASTGIATVASGVWSIAASLNDSQVIDALTISGAGSVADAALSSNVTTQGNTFNGANQLVRLTAGGALPAISGASLTGVNAAQLNSQSGSYYLDLANATGTMAMTRIGDGSVTNAKLQNSSLTVTAGTGLANGGSVSLGGSVTLNLANTTVVPSSYGSGSSVANFTVDSQGRLTSAANTSIAINANQITSGSFALGTQTTGDYVQNIGTLTGLSVAGNSGEGSTPALSVTYGSAINTSVQGNTSLTCATGTGNLTGGGNAITLGTGGTCNSISTNAAVSFGTSVTTPSITNGGALSLSATGGGNNLTLSAGGSIIFSGFNCTSSANGGVLTTNASGVVMCADDDGGAGGSISGSGTTDRIPLYTSSSVIGSSWLAQSGTTLQLDSGRDFTLLGGSVTATSFIGALTGNASTATALAANPTDCSANQFATAIAANGNLSCAALTDGDIPNTITIDLASTATALATNPTDCSSNQFANAIAANGNLTCAGINDADVSDTLTASLFVGSGSTTTAIDLATAEVAGNLRANNLQTVAADLGAADVTINLGNTNGSFNTNLTLDGTLTASSFSGALTGNAATATALAANPTDCSANQFATTIAANGNLTCAVLTDGDIPNSITIDLAATATALAANPSDCSANQFANAIAASGNLSCAGVTDADVSDTLTSSLFVGSGSTTTSIDLATAEVAGNLRANNLQSAGADLGAANVNVDLSNTNGAFVTNLTIDGSITAATFSGNLSGNATTATALATNPTDCSANQFANAIAANGNLTCAAITDGDVPNSITVDLSTAATSLAANPSDCSVNQFATTIEANGNLTCASITDADVADTLTASLFVGSGSTTTAIDLGTAEVAGTLTVDKGGTGIASYTIGDLIYASGTTTLSRLADVAAGSCLVSGGVGVAPTWGSCAAGGGITGSGTLNSLPIFTSSGTLGNSTLFQSGTTLQLATGNDFSLVSGTVTANTFVGALTGNASTATALAANPSDCSANQFANAIAANGNLSCAALTDGDIPDSITVTNATNATNLLGTGSTTNAVDLATAEVAGRLRATNLQNAASDLGAADVEVILSNSNGSFVTNLTLDGSVTAIAFIGALTGNASTATALAANPSDCAADMYANAIAANGNLTCSGITDAALSANVTLLGASITKDEITGTGTLAFTWSDSEVANSLTISSSGSVDDGALSANVTLLGAVIDLGGSEVSGVLADANVSDGLTISSSGSVADAALSANVTKLGSTIDLGTADVIGNLLATNLQNAATNLGAANVTVDLSNTNGSFVTNFTVDGTIIAATFSGAFSGNLTGNASTATALAANPTDCSANQFAISIVASGNLTCASLTDGDIPNSITIDLATSATALAANPADCTAGQYATSIVATGDLTCATVSEGQVSGAITDVTAGSGLTGGASSGNATLNIGAGNGITVNADDISVIYGSAANTAVQGNTTLVCASGTGNLSGGGTSITLGSGGTCGGITTNNAVTFTTSVTTPLITNAGVLTLSTTGANDLTLDSGSGVVNLNVATVKTINSLAYDLNNAGNTALSITNNGTGVANLNVVEGSIQTAGSTRITNTGVLQNVSADTSILTSGTLGVVRGGTGVNGSSAANGTLLIGNGSGYTLSTITQSDGITINNAAGSITIAATLGTSISGAEIDANAVALGAQTTGDYVASLGTLTGLSTTGNGGEGSMPTLGVNYGSAANTAVQGNTQVTISAGAGLAGGSTLTLGSGGTTTLSVTYGSTSNSAVQGNTTLTCPSGTGNLTGGGGTITLGTGGSCGSISTNNAVSFSTSVTTPLVQNAGTLTLGTTATGGIDDIIFNTAGGEVVRILENGDLKFEKGANDVTFAIATPGAPATYTFSGNTGTVLTSANYTGTLDATYVNTGESPTAADISGSFSGGLTINTDAVTTAKILNANVTNAKLQNSSLTVTAGTGLSGGGAVALGASTSLAVQYGAAAGTAVQGNTTLTCNSGSGNLSGGGGTITLGTGGSCGAISTNNVVSFTTSVTTPMLTNAGVLTVSTTGLNDLTLVSGSNTINLTATTLKTTTNLSMDLNSGSNTTLTVTNTGSGAASLSVEAGLTVGNLLTVSAGGFNVTGNSTINGTLSGLTGLTIASGGANITGTVTVVGPVVVGNTFTNTTGSIRWTGADFQGFDGAIWQSFTAAGGGGTSTGGRVQQSYEMSGTNQAANATTVLTPIFIGATATTIAAGSTGDVRMASAGSIRGCAIINSAAVTGGSVSVRFRKNGAQASATNYCTLNTTNTRTNSQEVPAADITFAAGDTVGVQLVSTALAPTSLEHRVTLSVEFGTPTTVNGFANGGNAFAAAALLGTTDNFALSLMTNNTTVLSLATSGLATFNGAVTMNGALTVAAGGASVSGGLNVNSSGVTNAGNITGVGANITGTGALTVASGGSGNLTLDSASNIISIATSDTTLQRSAAGTFTIDLSNNTVTTLAIDNSTVGSTNLNLVDGALQTAGTTRLTNAGVLQNITGLTVSSGGASIAGGATITGNSTLGGSSTDRLTIVSQILGGSPLAFQGATDNAFTTTFAVTDPTANNTITIPNASGTLVLDSRSIQTAANSGLSGGGNLGSDRSLSLDINNLSAITTTSNTDYLAVYDSGTSSVKKVSRSDFLQGVIGALTYKGTWNASTNTPVLSDGSGSNGEVYVVSVGATRDLGSGNIIFAAGDFVIHNGTRWEVAPSSSDVASVFGRTGSITAQNGDYTAVQITNTPAGSVAANTVQAALNELDTEKLGSLNGLTATSQMFANDTNVTISSVGSTHTLGWSGQLSVARGGTGAGSFTANGVMYGNGTGALQVTAAGTPGQLLVANASGVPVFVSASGDISLTATGLMSINADSVTLGADTIGSYVSTIGSLTGLTTSGNSGEGSTPTLSVTYGTSANTAVQGSTTLTCATGTGNLSGGGTLITLGSGGTCGAIGIINNPTFSSSVITPTLNSASTLTLVSGGGSDILLDSASGIISLAADDTTLERIAAGSYTINLNDTADTTLSVTNSGAGAATLSVEGGGTFGANLTVSAGGITVTGNSSITGTLTGLTGLTVASGGANITGGVDNNSGGITNAGNISGSNSYQSVNNTNLTLDAQGTGSIVFTGYNCTGNNNGGALTANASGVVACSDDDATLSDSRLKMDVVNLGNDILDKIKNIRTVNFDFDCDQEFFLQRVLDCRTDRQTGVIAQELAVVFPELVTLAADGFYRVNYKALNLYNTKAISELAGYIESDGDADLTNISTNGTLRLSSGGALQNITGLGVSSGGASITGDVSMLLGASDNLELIYSGAPSSDFISITNFGQGTTTDQVDGISLTFATDAVLGARTNAALNLNVTSGATEAADILYGIKVSGITGQSGQETAVLIGAGWDNDLSFADNSPTIQLAGTDNSAVLSIVDTAATPNNLLEFKDLSTNFGGYLETGALMSRNSYFAEEFSRERPDIILDAPLAWGDTGAWAADEQLTTSNDCTFSVVDDNINGIGRIATADVNTSCNSYTSSIAIGNAQLMFDADNLPVVLMKIKPSAANANNDTWAGISNSVATDANLPTSGIFFTNNDGNTWTGVTRDASVSTNVTCTGATISTTQFALLKIEVISSTNVKFYVDTDVSNGVNWTLCGTSTTNIPTAALAGTLKTSSTTSGFNLDIDFFRVSQDDSLDHPDLSSLQVDESTPEESSSQDQAIEDDMLLNMVVGTLDADTIFTSGVGQRYAAGENGLSTGDVVSVDSSGLIYKSTTANQRGVVGVIGGSAGLILGTETADNQVTVAAAGRAIVRVTTENGAIQVGDALTSSSIPGVAMRANDSSPVIGIATQVFSGAGEGQISMNVSNASSPVASMLGASDLTNRIDQLEQAFESMQTQTTSNIDLSNLTVGRLRITLDMFAEGGLNVSGLAEFQGMALFNSMVTFRDSVVIEQDLEVLGRLTLNNSAGGFATIDSGRQTVHVSFSSPYVNPPLITISLGGGKFAQYSYNNVTEDGFDIILAGPANENLQFSWTATSISNPNTYIQQ